MTIPESLPLQESDAEKGATEDESLEKQPLKHTASFQEEKGKGRPEREGPNVVFETASKYDFFIWFVLSICLASVGFELFTVYREENILDEERRKEAFHELIWTPISILTVFALVLPISLQVRSDASIGIRTICVTWSFPDATAAYENPSVMEHCGRPRYKFASALWSNRVLVRRCKGRWDVLVSPKDAQGFVQAVRSVASEMEQSSAED